MSDNVLIDTTVWVEYFRKKESPISRQLKLLIEKNRVAICGVIYSEVLQGARDDVQELRALFSKIPRLEMSWDVFEKAGLVSRDLRKAGQPLPMSDCLIASAALCHGTTLLTLDGDFKRVSGLEMLDQIP